MTLNDFIVFIYESGICLAVLFAMYLLFLRRETYFRFNRFYLLSALVLAFVLPLANLAAFYNSNNLSSFSGISRLSETISLPAVTITHRSGSLSTPAYNWRGIALVIYLLGTSLLFTRVIMGIIRVEMLKRKGRRIVLDGYYIVFTRQEISPFSFFKTIYLNDKLAEETDSKYIINHEIIHIKQRHTYDNLFVELFLAVFWFNPFMWFLKSALRENHEYLADNGVLNQKANSAVYQTLLLKQTIGLAPVTLTSTFNSTIKNRIIMMCKNRSSVLAKFKPLLLVPIVAALFLVFSCTEYSSDPADGDPMETKTQANPELILEADAGQNNSGSEERELFYIVEEMPTFNGGDPVVEFRKYIAQNLVYPELEAINGISGRVIVQFIVDKEGKVVEPTVVRGVSQALDREAVRVIQSSPLWTPGKQNGQEVDVLYTFPLNFVLQ